MDITVAIAWYGAVIATLVLIWDFVKWRKTGPIIKRRVVLNVHYEDGEIRSDEKVDGLQVTTYQEYCHVELVNVGDQPTTVMGISIVQKRSKGTLEKGYNEQAFKIHFGKKLPCLISPGEVWSCRLPMNIYEQLIGNGPPEIRVGLSHLNKPFTFFYKA